MEYRDVPHLLREMYEDALVECNDNKTERYRLAILGLVRGFEADMKRLGIPIQTPERQCVSARHCARLGDSRHDNARLTKHSRTLTHH